jgi:hypothetical protein
MKQGLIEIQYVLLKLLILQFLARLKSIDLNLARKSAFMIPSSTALNVFAAEIKCFVIFILKSQRFGTSLQGAEVSTVC